jgi:hypothetical protein
MGLREILGGGDLLSIAKPLGMMGRFRRTLRRRAMLRAWARGELDFAGALSRSPGLPREL